MKLGLSNKIILIVESTAFVVAVSCGVAALFVQKNTLESLTNSQLQSVAVLKEYSIMRFINHTTEELEALAKSVRTKDTLTTFLRQQTDKEKQEVRIFLNELGEEGDIFADVFIMDKNGIIVAAVNQSEEGKIRSNESFFLNAKVESKIQDFHYNITTGKPELIITTPIADKNGVFLGVLAGKIRLEEVSTIMLEKSGLGETGESFLINSYNIAVTDLSKEPGVALKKTIYLPQTTECLKGNSVSGLRTDYHGDEVLGYWYWLPEIRSCLVTKIDTQEVFAPMWQIAILLSGIIGIIGLSVGIIGYIFGQKIVRPLYRLRDLALKVREGDFKMRADTDSGDEISDIAFAFNDMIEHVSKYTDDLETEVKERTEEIRRKISESEKLDQFMIGREVRMVELKKEIEALKKSIENKQG